MSRENEIVSDNDDVSMMDEEGLRRHYDVILVGTGLVHSILASALSRAGKSVLHTDNADYYGELDAVWTLPYLESQQQQQQQSTATPSSSSWWFHPSTANEVTETSNVLTNPDKDATTERIIPLSSRGGLHDLEFHSIGRPTRDLSSTVHKFNKGTAVMIPPWGHAIVLGWQPTFSSNVDEESTTTTTTTTTTATTMNNAKNNSSTELLDALPACDDNDVDWQQQNYEVVLELTDWKLAHGKFARITTVQFDSIVSIEEMEVNEILERRSRSFAIDVSPGLIWAQGSAVVGLLQSSVSEYVEFKSLEQLWWYEVPQKGDTSSSSSFSSLQAVPCSKNDVFSSTLLTPMEKRRLMKFLQLALDYSVAESEVTGQSTENMPSSSKSSDVDTGGSALPAAWETLNERHLNQGRSLARPQNKSVGVSGLEALQHCIKEEMDFEEYLMTHPKLSPKLTALVRYALALDFGNGRMTVGRGMRKLGEHLQSLGRFGKTAFLVPLFGSGELSQAFCRSAAVYGATYLLRRCVTGIQFSPDGNTLEGVLLHPYVDNKGASDTPEGVSDTREAAPCKLVRGSHVIVPENAVLDPKPAPRLRVLRRVSILNGKPTPEFVRHAVLVPPESLEKSNHPHTIHGLWFDETLNVTPSAGDCGGCSMFHLTTVMDANAVDEKVLEEAVEAILKGSSLKEIYRISFSYALYDGDVVDKTRDRMHVIRRSPPSLTLDKAFDQARSVFQKICPNTEFLTLSEEIDNMVKERFGDRLEDDDEEVALSNAMNLIQSQKEASEPLFIWLGDPEIGATPQRLLLPVPRPTQPTQSSDNAVSVIRLIEEHCSRPGHDSRIYFATCSDSSSDALDFCDLIRTVTARAFGRHLQFFAFTNGLKESLKCVDLGLNGIHVSLFAPDASGYCEATGLDEASYQMVCNFISEQARSGVSVEVGILSDHAEAGRVFARTLGAKEVHVFPF